MAQDKLTVDEYIARAGDFAKPILSHLRLIIRKTCPEVEEAIKWGIPHFDYKGAILCMLAAYKQHCSFSFHKAALMSSPRLKGNDQLKPTERFMGKITQVSELPPDKELVALIKEAMALNEQGVKVAKAKSDRPREIEMPGYFTKALEAHPQAKKIFDAKSASFRKDYLVWIIAAKTEATRDKRIEEALTWIAEGKGRFWKYEK